MTENIKRVGFGIRLAAYLIDGLIIGLIVFIIGVIFAAYIRQNIFAGGFVFAYLFTGIILILYLIFAEGKYGYTIGKRLCNLRVVTEDNRKIGYLKAFMRRISFIIPFLCPIDSLFIFRKNKQRLFDQVAKTIVIKYNGVVAN